MYLISMENLKSILDQGQDHFTLTLDERKHLFRLSWIKVGYGQRCYLVCPVCGKRYNKLYIINQQIKCRECGDLKKYWAIQNSTKGGYTELEYRMGSYAKKHSISFKYPFDYTDFMLDDRWYRKRFKDALKVLQALENMRMQAILLNVTFKPAEIRSVMSGEHKILKKHSHEDLKDYVYPWGSGKDYKYEFRF